MSTNKTLTNLVVLGDTDCGKSTVIGRILYSYSVIENRITASFENALMNNTSFNYAQVLCKFKLESETPINIVEPEFDTAKHFIYIVDVPGHPKFLINMITDMSQANCALLVIDAREREFEESIFDNSDTRGQVKLAHVLGVTQIIVCVNKMDITIPPFSESRFDEIKGNVSSFLNEVGYQLDVIHFIPISATRGDNIVWQTQNMKWYCDFTIRRKTKDKEVQVNMKTLIDALDSIQPPTLLAEKPLRLPLQEVYTIGGPLFVGRVESGVIKSDMNIMFAPPGVSVVIKYVEMNHAKLTEVGPGNIVEFNLKQAFCYVYPGYICSDLRTDPAREAINFTALVIIVNNPNQICQGYEAVLDCDTTTIQCIFTILE